METTVIGYDWCPHYQHVVTQLKPCNTITFKTTNREDIQQAVDNTIGTRRRIGNPGVTSPQIICCRQNYAVCIDGESGLNQIGDAVCIDGESGLKQIGDSLEAYVTRQGPTFSQYLVHSVQTQHV